MTTSPDKQLVIPLNEGVTEGVVEDNAGGIITASENTRLTKLKGTLSRRPLMSVVTGSLTNPCGGLVAGGRQSICAYYEGGASRRISDVTSELTIASATGTAGPNAFYPYPLVDAGPVGGAAVGLAPATCFDAAGNQWFAAAKIIAGTTYGIFISVLGSGIDLIAPRAVHTQTGYSFWCGLTPCTGGVVVWYEDTAGISASRLTISGTTLTVGTPVSVYTPVEPSGYLQADVTSDGANTGYLLCRDNGSNVVLDLHKVNLTTLAVTATVQIAGIVANTSPPLYLCVTYITSGGTNYVAIASSEGAGVTYKSVRNATTLASIWAVGGVGRYGPVSCQPWFTGGNNYIVFANTITGTVIGTNTSGVIFDTYQLVAGTLIDEGYVYWYGLQSKGAAHTTANGTSTYPYFPLFARWGQGGAPPTVSGGVPTFYMDTPSIEIVTPYSPTVFTPVMRCGVDTVSAYSSIVFNSAPCAVSSDGRLCVAYITDRPDQPKSANALFGARYCVFDLRPSTQPATALDTGGVSVVGGAMPAVWDGTESTEYAPFHRPRIAVIAAGGAGPVLTGSYQYSAVVSWLDAYGNVRRSAPALPYPIALAGTSPKIFVTVPLTMKQGERQEMFTVSVYGTTAGGAVFIALNAQTITRGTVGCWEFDTIPDPVLGDVTLYSQFSGIQQLQPECPPPIWDVRSISGRLWVIDAENRYRLLPSKLKEDGIAFEFNSNLQILGFDVQYGKLMAVVDVSGTPVVLSERGVWQIDGYGPDNTGRSGVFVDPRLISNMGCRARHSVAQIPGVGVMFQANDGRFCLLAGGFKRFETFGIYDVQTPTVHLLQNEVIYPLTDGTGFVVYNWLSDAWVHWPTATQHLPMSCTLQSSTRSRTYYATPDGGSEILYLDSDSVDTDNTHPISVTRGWITPEPTPQSDMVVREVWIQGLSNGYLNGDGILVGEAGYTVTVSFDFNDSNSVSRSWTAAEVYALAVGGKVTLGINCQAAQARSVKVRVDSVFDANSNAEFNPLSILVVYAATGQLRRRVLRAGALK